MCVVVDRGRAHAGKGGVGRATAFSMLVGGETIFVSSTAAGDSVFDSAADIGYVGEVEGFFGPPDVKGGKEIAYATPPPPPPPPTSPPPPSPPSPPPTPPSSPQAPPPPPPPPSPPPPPPPPSSSHPLCSPLGLSYPAVPPGTTRRTLRISALIDVIQHAHRMRARVTRSGAHSVHS